MKNSVYKRQKFKKVKFWSKVGVKWCNNTHVLDEMWRPKNMCIDVITQFTLSIVTSCLSWSSVTQRYVTAATSWHLLLSQSQFLGFIVRFKVTNDNLGFIGTPKWYKRENLQNSHGKNVYMNEFVFVYLKESSGIHAIKNWLLISEKKKELEKILSCNE